MKEFTLPFQAVVFLNYFGSVPNKGDFFRTYLVGMFPSKSPFAVEAAVQ